MGGRSGGRAKTQAREQGDELPVDGGGRVFQVRLGLTHQTKDGTSSGPSSRHAVQDQQEIASKVTDGRRKRILQQTRDQSVERARHASFFHGGRYQGQCGGTIQSHVQATSVSLHDHLQYDQVSVGAPEIGQRLQCLVSSKYRQGPSRRGSKQCRRGVGHVVRRQEKEKEEEEKECVESGRSRTSE